MMESAWLDVRQAVRTLRGSPLFSTVAVLSLAVGIAGTTIIFGLTDAYLLRPRPGISEASTLVEVGRSASGGDPFSSTGFSTFSYPNYLDYRERQTVFSDLAATRAGVPFGLAVDGSASSVTGDVRIGQFLLRARRARRPWSRLSA